MEQLIKEAGGEFAPDLSGTCTHLLATRPTGKKFEAAKVCIGSISISNVRAVHANCSSNTTVAV